MNRDFWFRLLFVVVFILAGVFIEWTTTAEGAHPHSLSVAFEVTDEATGQPVKGAVVALRAVEKWATGGELHDIALKTDVQGKATFFSRVMTYGKRSSLRFINTWHCHYPIQVCTVEVEGYEKLEHIFPDDGADSQLRHSRSPVDVVHVALRKQ